SDQYKIAAKFLKEIADEVRKEKHIPIHFVLCPGNHDCNFELNTQIRALALEALAKKGTGAIDESVIQACCAVQKPYLQFVRTLNPEYASPEGDELWQTLRYEVGGKDVLFDCVNVAWMSRIKEEPGTLNFPFDRYIRENESRPELR